MTFAIPTADCVITVAWVEATGQGFVTYTVYRSTTDPATTADTVLVTGISDLSFLDTTFTNGTTYYYIIEAKDSCGVPNQTATNAPSFSAIGSGCP